MRKYESLNGLRAIAAIGIVLMHVRANIDVSVSDSFLYTHVIGKMSDFVFLFMIVSAFSLCCGYYDRFKNGCISLNDFYKRRYNRILPFFAILVLISIAIPHSPNKAALTKASVSLLGSSGYPPFVESIFEGFTELTLSYGLLPNPTMSIMGVGWFLGVIFLFYMLFPYFVFMMDNKRRAWKSLIIANVVCFITVEYFYSDKFLCYEIVPRNFMYNVPFFVLGGVIFLYKDFIEKIVTRYKLICLAICFLLTLGYWLSSVFMVGYWAVIIISVVMGAWMTFAIGPTSSVLHNRFVDYLSGISMEIYLCHMMSFWAVSMLHLSRYIQCPDVLYWMTCLLTLVVSVIFSHIVKYMFLPKVEPYLFKSSK